MGLPRLKGSTYAELADLRPTVESGSVGEKKDRGRRRRIRKALWKNLLLTTKHGLRECYAYALGDKIVVAMHRASHH